MLRTARSNPLRFVVQYGMESLGHILFDGPPGLGKTTFAVCIPNELGVNSQLASGAGLKAPKDLVPYLTNAEKHSVLFIDVLAVLLVLGVIGAVGLFSHR